MLKIGENIFSPNLCVITDKSLVKINKLLGFKMSLYIKKIIWEIMLMFPLGIFYIFVPYCRIFIIQNVRFNMSTKNIWNYPDLLKKLNIYFHLNVQNLWTIIRFGSSEFKRLLEIIF